MLGQITISNKSKKIARIDIEGIIGVPEEYQEKKSGDIITTYRKLKSAIGEIKKIEAKSVVVNIRSTGGNVNDALLIYDALTELDCEVTTRCYGYVASAATIIAQAAAKGKREISRNALYLIHRSSSATEGNSEQLSQTIELLNKTDEKIAGIYADKSGKDFAGFLKLMDENNGNGKWMSPEEVIESGLADSVISAERISNSAHDMVRQLNLPEIPEKFLNGDKKMNISKHWNEIFKALGLVSDERVSSRNIKEEGQDIGKRKAEDVSDLEKIIEEYETPKETAVVAELKNRIIELEAANAKLRAKATLTFPKEDPSMRDMKIERNAEAYEKDVVNFKNY